MTKDEALAAIESPYFSGHINIASRFADVASLLAQQKPVRVLMTYAEEPREAAELLVHVVNLCKRSFDVRYENPWDAALTAYLWILQQKHPEFAGLAAERIAHATHTWWAGKLARHLLFDRTTSSEGAEQRSSLTSKPSKTDMRSELKGESVAFMSALLAVSALTASTFLSGRYFVSSDSSEHVVETSYAVAGQMSLLQPDRALYHYSTNAIQS